MSVSGVHSLTEADQLNKVSAVTTTTVVCVFVSSGVKSKAVLIY